MSIALETATVDLRSPSVFEAGLPTVDYENAPGPHEAHRRLAAARSQAPIAMGAHGPELLRYELVRTALRDARMCVPEGLGLEAQGITSGPLWDRASTTLLSINGEDHTRLRRLVSKAFTPRSVGRLDTTITDIITQLTDPLVAAGRCEVVEDIARPYPVPVIAELLGAPREDAKLFSAWADDFFKLFSWNVARTRAGDPDGLERTRRLHRRHGRRTPQIAHRRPDLRTDSRRGRRRPPDDRGAAHARCGHPDGRHRHHPQPARRGGRHPVRPPRAVGPARRAPGAGDERGRRADALLPRHLRRDAHDHGGRRVRGCRDPGRHVRHGQHVRG